MEHLRLAIALMVLLSGVTFWVTIRAFRRLSPRMLDALALLTVILGGLYIRFIWGQLWIVNWIPLPSVIVLSNWFPILTALLAGILWLRMADKPWWRKSPMLLVLLAATAGSIFYVIPMRPPECGNEWIPAAPPVPFRVCQQTTKQTCSAAATATLLECLGYEATEAEMAKLCLTRGGTTWLGMYHGLSIKLLATGQRVRFFEGTVDDLAALTETRPVLLCCQLTAAVAEREPRYHEQSGWIPGVSHSVVCFGQSRGLYFIGDPSQKRMERWSAEDMANLWTGTGLMVAGPDRTTPAENETAE